VAVSSDRPAIAVGGEHDPVRPSASLVAEAAGSPRERPGNGEIVTVDKPISFHDDDDEQAASMAGVRGFGSSYLSDSGRPVGFRLPGIASLDIDEANNVLQMTLEDRQSSVATNSTCWLLRIAWHPEH
jgi:hypothetical protein